MYVLRDLLQLTSNLSEAVEYLENAKRTWSIHVGVGSREDNALLGFDYAAHVLNIYTDHNHSG